MNGKLTLICVFVMKNTILSFLEKLRNEYHVKTSRVFVYDVDGNDKEYLVTFNTFHKENFVGKLRGATVINSKGGCFFSINALNELTSSMARNEDVDWKDYNGMLLMVSSGKLRKQRVTKIDDKCVFLQ